MLGNAAGVCKTRTGYLRMANADGKMRIEKCGSGKKNADNRKRKRKKTRNADGKKIIIIIKQTKERNLSFKSLPIVGTVLYPVIPFINVTEIRTLRSSSLNAHILSALLL